MISVGMGEDESGPAGRRHFAAGYVFVFLAAAVRAWPISTHSFEHIISYFSDPSLVSSRLGSQSRRGAEKRPGKISWRRGNMTYYSKTPQHWPLTEQ